MATNTTIKACIDKARHDIAEAYELDPEILERIHEIILNACKPVLDHKPAKEAASKGATKTRRPMSAYNMYVREQFRISHEEGSTEKGTGNSQQIMSTVSGQWAKLSQEEKDKYIEMAKAVNEDNKEDSDTADTSKSKSKSSKSKSSATKSPKAEVKRRLTGYNLFYRENKDNIKANKEEGLTTMKAVGQAWHDLTQSERDAYNEKAATTED